MPYIDKERRRLLTSYDKIRVAGELNWKFSRAIVDYLKVHGLNYQTCNDIVGALENAKHEFQRRVQDPYEDLKIIENGDIGYEDFETRTGGW